MRRCLVVLPVALVLSVVLLSPGCGSGDSGESTPSRVSSVESGDGITVSLNASPDATPVGRDISLTLTVQNTSPENNSFELGSGQTYDFIAYSNEGEEVWRWSEGMFFTQVVTAVTIEPGGSEVFEVSWSTMELNPGEYTVEGIFLGLPDLKPRTGVQLFSGREV